MQHLSAKDFFKPTPYNQDTKNQIWMSQIADSHDNICDCKSPFAHLLASIFPPGHKDRDSTINQILLRDYTELCRSGGAEEEGPGLGTGGEGIKEEKPLLLEGEDFIKDEELEELIKLGEDAANTR